jgi:phosphatidylglycerophosphatase A
VRFSPASTVATFFGIGLLPKMPGTWGSLAALPFAWGIAAAGGPWALLGAAVVAFGIGVWASSRVFDETGVADAPTVVIDEVAAQWLVLAPFVPDWKVYGLGFLLFRLADILKPWPCSWIDRDMKNGFGVMLDDTAAAVYAGLGVFLIQLWFAS